MSCLSVSQTSEEENSFSKRLSKEATLGSTITELSAESTHHLSSVIFSAYSATFEWLPISPAKVSQSHFSGYTISSGEKGKTNRLIEVEKFILNYIRFVINLIREKLFLPFHVSEELY